MLDRPSTPYRESLDRSVPFELVRAEGGDSGDGLTIEGYGAVVGDITQIDSWEGTFDEVIAPGAFKKSLRERTPIMQFDHGRHPLLGSVPLGRWETAEEDDRGLHVVGRLSDNWLVEPFRDAIRDGGVTGMSFRFSVVREEWTDKDGKRIKDDELTQLLWYGAGDRGPILRTLKELRVSEVGPVVWPAYETTTVGVRGAADRFVVELGVLDVRTAHGRSVLARAVVLAEEATTTPGSRPGTAPVRAPQIPAAPAAGTTEPPATERTADEHAPAAPPVTDASAGEHSSARDRKARMTADLARVRAAMTTIKT